MDEQERDREEFAQQTKKLVAMEGIEHLMPKEFALDNGGLGLGWENFMLGRGRMGSQGVTISCVGW